MKESRDSIERRQHKRANVQNIVLGILSSGELETIGSITDISLDGVRCAYDDLRIAPNNNPIHSIDLIAENYYLCEIPCEYAWNVIVETQPYSKLTNLRQCGIQFGRLTPNQIFLLKSFINICTTIGAKDMISNAYI